MPALKYPTSYRSRKARELSTPGERPRTDYKSPAHAANDRPPAKSAWDRAFDSVGGRPNMVGPHTPGLGLDKVIRKHGEYIATQLRNGNVKAAANAAYRGVRGLAKGKDIRLELALSLLDKVFEGAANYSPPLINNGQLDIVNPPNSGYVVNAAWRGREYFEANNNVGTWLNEWAFSPSATMPVADEINVIDGAIEGGRPGIIATDWPFGANGVRFTQNYNRASGSASLRYRYASIAIYRKIAAHPLPYLAPYVVPPGAPYPNSGGLTTMGRRDPMARASARPGRKPWHGKTSAAPGYTRKYKPPVKSKDTKHHISMNNRSWYGRIANGVTEGLDIVDAAFSAVGGNGFVDKTPQEKLKRIWERRDQFDPGEFIRKLVENQIEDYVYGRLGRISAKASRQGGFTAGLQAGGWDTEFQYNTQDYNIEAAFKE